ncbi:hypothetical protein LXT21_02015 [Myxococcus sp. K38C18041901]|uniref:hypothetical protein n=1 Tax=Myxococcus guangdongensis TaxID=2906760 RepID=UPI0020A7853C|nr:hypothetical protein [Myxococcus guangdongensis]MCP3057546.1 hypothetical protein [Myxococcus guangdongensis]
MTVSAPRSGSLPGNIRFAALVACILAALTGWASLNEATELAHFYEVRSQHLEKGPPLLLGNDPAVLQHLLETQYQALEPMREPRAALMGVLAVACAFVFVSALRMLRPGDLPRGAMGRMLGRAAVTVAVLRTIDGAQWAVVARRVGVTLAQTLAQRPEYQDPSAAEAVTTVAPWLALGMTVAGTTLIAGTFAVLGQFFRSESVRQALVTQDGPVDG